MFSNTIPRCPLRYGSGVGRTLCRTGTCARISSIKDEAWCAPYRRYTNHGRGIYFSMPANSLYWDQISQKIPGGTCPLGHGIGFPSARSAALRAFRIDPFGYIGERGFSRICWDIVFDIRQCQRKLVLGHRHPSAFLTMNQRYWFSPISLAGKYPISQLVVYLSYSYSLIFKLTVNLNH